MNALVGSAISTQTSPTRVLGYTLCTLQCLLREFRRWLQSRTRWRLIFLIHDLSSLISQIQPGK